MSLKSDLSERVFSKLLTGISKVLYQLDINNNNANALTLLQEQVFGEHSHQEQNIALFRDLTSYIQQAFEEDWSLQHLQEELSKTNISQPHAQCFEKFYINEGKLIRSASSCGSSKKLKSLAWRVDVRTHASHVTNEINESTALVEMRFLSPQKNDDDVVFLEFNRGQLNSLRNEINKIEDSLQRHV